MRAKLYNFVVLHKKKIKIKIIDSSNFPEKLQKNCHNFNTLIFTPGIQKHVTVLNTRNGTKVYIGMIKAELYLFSNNKQCGHLPTANVYIHIEYYF